MPTLGIFISSDRYPEYLWSLARAARDKGLRVYVHFYGSAVRLVGTPDFHQLHPAAGVTICRESAEQYHVDRKFDSCRLAPSDCMGRLIRECDRHVFL